MTVATLQRDWKVGWGWSLCCCLLSGWRRNRILDYLGALPGEIGLGVIDGFHTLS